MGDSGESSQDSGTPATERPPAGSDRARRARKIWLSPGGISAIAAALAAVAALIGLFVQQREPAATPNPTPAPPSVGAEPALFVYGSSMPGMSRYDAIGRYVIRSARDTVRGSLYDSGLGYPMAKFGGDGQIRGVVLWLDPATAEAALAEMTRVEAGLFHPVTVRTASGVSAQAYQWIGSTDGFPTIDAWDGSTAHYGARIGWPELKPGDCFQAFDDQTVTTSWCKAPHALEAFHTGTLKEGAADPRSAAERACRGPFAEFVGRDPEDSELVLRVYSHSASESRTPAFLCAVGADGEAVAGTLSGADR
ncbi:MAG TPA: gamma-glutamylcyclotransferase [Micropruina sp.]|nr:gamma-glutamylcyclotransferase [Propionibacterium sp.]HMQ36212.1 gamma-glutamylcyclotransferase [Micropruina sp.]HMR21587.1 gamma-glutamylcyclotransferase [Micropruina sp.]